MSEHVPYTSNASLEEVAAFLRKATRVALLTHSKPDGDAVGCTLALARTLIRLGKQALPVYLPPWQARMQAVIGTTPVMHEHHGCWDQPPLSEVDAVAILDTGSWNQLADAKKFLVPRRAMSVIVDHHRHGDGDIADLRHVAPESASASELVARLCAILLNIDSYARLPVEIAEPIYLGIATDTGWFRYSNMTSSTLRLGADLIDAGVDPNRLYRQIEQADTPSRLRLIQRALASLEFLADGRAAIMSLSKKEISETGASQDEIGGLTDLPQTVGSVRVVAVLNELEEKLTKVSLRSKAADPGQKEIDVNALAQTLGGGGHIHAAGVKIHLPLAEARARIASVIAGAVA